MAATKAISFYPSFKNYSSDRVSETDTKVTDEKTRFETLTDYDGDFEFVSVSIDSDVTNEIFPKIRHNFPVFGRDLLIHDYHDRNHDNKPDESTRRWKLKELFIHDERDPWPTLSSGADELESVQAGTYCLWRPNLVEYPPSGCKKSSSTGSLSKNGKLRDLLLRRSKREGEDDSLEFPTSKKSEQKAEKQGRIETVKAGKVKAKVSSSAHEEFYVRIRTCKGREKKKSYLPYRQHLVGCFPTSSMHSG